MARSTVTQANLPRKHTGGCYAPRTARVTEDVLVDTVCALDSAAAALSAVRQRLDAARARLVNDANAHLGRHAA